ncbi:MAG: sulfotransferase [Balneolaceae bacterium]
MNKEKSSKRPFSHPLYGSDLKNLLNLTSQYGSVSAEYRLQWMTAIASSIGRSPFTALEKFTTSKAFKKIKDLKPPIFIVGHWRTGTTHLGNILSKSPQFGFVSPIATGLPWNLLLIGKWFRPLLEKSLPSDRLIDKVKVKPDSPQEDAFGIANMQTISFAHGLYFTSDFEKSFNKGVFLDGATKNEIDEWIEKHRYFLKKVYLDQNQKQLIIRNPAYTTRIPLLKKIWPGAKFIHIYRDPYRVFQSMRNYFRNLFPALALQPYDHIDIDKVILENYVRMMNQIITDTKNLSESEFIEIRFEDLDQNALGIAESIYTQLQLSGFDADKPYLVNYLNSIKRYKKNVYQQSDEDKALIEKHWQPFIDHWKY